MDTVTGKENVFPTACFDMKKENMGHESFARKTQSGLQSSYFRASIQFCMSIGLNAHVIKY